MALALQTLKDGKLILAKVSQAYLAPEQTQFYDAINMACDQSPTPVCSILDLEISTHFPPNLLSMNLRNKHLPLNHPNFGLSVVVTQSNFIRSIGDAGIKVGKFKNVRITGSLDIAMEMVEAFLVAQSAKALT